ncbi:MAG: cell division protein FtsH [Tenericutes bacterium GWC2_34_14]|nr:MAG: cell division protein FtsH [Tenericutes bacterium GWA2_35_7]OHE28078.1 MAG: cell division protein FtsH [Tenericutes bacterium GWC2_34_14]OHE32981.1 MAG: cell division protein FtsH [Tenericutes bacterium GWE2_34_108]OHE36053.1 MAG: cell division protein FtsH [Tenericutes bacterium GWF1_35_14]OHE39276.1 MAG: cell division protein FtsH [Tenericutes bacterium GWF2_35_184]OHE44551.1 MAG: cell division protein FtsH [Tenericutes bacterium RIFOXYA2_FULL_36_32]OHE46966.1 MAG: cell division pro
MNQSPNNKKKVDYRKKPDYLIMLFTLVIVIGVFLFLRDALQGEVATLNVTELTQAADLGHIESLKYTPVGGDNITLVEIQGTFYKDSASASFYGTVSFEGIMPLENAQQIMLTVESKGGETLIGVRSGITIWTVLLNLVPMILVLVILFIIFRNANSQNSKAFDFAKNRARLNREKSITFKDVAGVEEEKQELEELIDFLKNPKKYVDMGARIPKGVLLVGSPGTGKTLLARAVAGEANVPFFSISGSDFVEMFVGVGASRVRDLFKVAKENSPCIIFIDEIDAVGRQRGAGLGGGHDEREQTLNQLLVEMDGFTTNMGIIIIAATNRPDVLDPALLRPGRFDRQITITLPDIRGREAILKVHARNKKLDPKVKLSEFASRIPGFSGADIENLLNEAALLAARDNRTLISQIDMDEAIDRVMMGPAKKSRKYSPEEKKTVAYHEAGHAVIGIKLEDANVVQKVTIIPRGRTGGYNLMVPLEEKFLSTKSSLIAQITSFLGGRVAEELVFDTVTTGAYNDFQNATAIARAMVTEYGMSDLGPVQYESAGGNVFLGRDYFKEKNFSDQVAHEIDKEVRHIITTCFEKAKKIITENRDLLDLIAHYLVEVETLTKADIDEIVTTGKLSWYQEKQENDNAA